MIEAGLRGEAASDQGPTGGGANRDGRGRSLLSLAVFDVGGPLVVYYALRSSGSSTVMALLVSGSLPAIGVGLSARQHKRVDAIGVVVLLGILAGAAVGLAGGGARWVLLDGTVVSAVLGFACFGSLLTGRPLMFRMALQFVGVESAQGCELESNWRYREFRRVFSFITAVWGAAFLAETIAQVVIIESASPGVAKTTANILPIVLAGVLVVWTVMYGRWRRARGEGGTAGANP